MSLTQLGRYKITGTLGRGAMGVVYRAHDPLIEREVAIKAVSCVGLTHEESDDFEQRFFREAKSAGRLNHPNIVTVHDVGRSDDLSYIAMEFLVGRSLRDILDSGSVLPVDRIARIAAEIADGLAFAHSHDIVHRDIKPANIMVLDNGTVKITDFGIALLPSSSLTMVGTAMGTPKYMSPEQVVGRKADGRSDIFSLGAMLYEMLSGHPPFAGDDLNAILYQVLNVAPPLPSSLNPNLPQGFDRIVARAMAKDPEKRYPNASEMAADLRNVKHISGLMQKVPESEKPLRVETPAVNSPLVAGEKSKRLDGRRRVLRYGVVLAVLALIGGGLLLRPVTPTPVVAGSTQSRDAGTLPPAAPQESVRSTTQVVAPVAEAPASGEEVAVSQSKGDTAKAARKTKAENLAAKAKVREAERVAADGEIKPASTGDWHSALRADVQACDREPFFRRILCIDKARRQYCPGHWGSVDECAVQTNNR